MQQTQKYKLNLIERNDPFLPDALNQNTQKLEDVLSAAVEEHQAETDARLTVLEARKLFIGAFWGPGNLGASWYHVPLPFKPKAVVVCTSHGGPQMWMSTDGEGGGNDLLHLEEDGFEVSPGYATSGHGFLAFG